MGLESGHSRADTRQPLDELARAGARIQRTLAASEERAGGAQAAKERRSSGARATPEWHIEALGARPGGAGAVPERCPSSRRSGVRSAPTRRLLEVPSPHFWCGGRVKRADASEGAGAACIAKMATRARTSHHPPRPDHCSTLQEACGYPSPREASLTRCRTHSLTCLTRTHTHTHLQPRRAARTT